MDFVKEKYFSYNEAMKSSQCKLCNRLLKVWRLLPVFIAQLSNHPRKDVESVPGSCHLLSISLWPNPDGLRLFLRRRNAYKSVGLEPVETQFSSAAPISKLHLYIGILFLCLQFSSGQLCASGVPFWGRTSSGKEVIRGEWDWRHLKSFFFNW